MNALEIGLTVAAVRLAVQRMELDAPNTDAAELWAALDAAVPDADPVLAALCRAAGEAEANAEAVAERIKALGERKGRYDAQAADYRRHIATLLDAAGMTRWKSAEFTVSLTPGRAGVVITDAAAVPDDFVRIRREPDKTAIGAALASGADIPGATMANGMPQLRILTK